METLDESGTENSGTGWLFPARRSRDVQINFRLRIKPGQENLNSELPSGRVAGLSSQGRVRGVHLLHERTRSHSPAPQRNPETWRAGCPKEFPPPDSAVEK